MKDYLQKKTRQSLSLNSSNKNIPERTLISEYLKNCQSLDRRPVQSASENAKKVNRKNLNYRRFFSLSNDYEKCMTIQRSLTHVETYELKPTDTPICGHFADHMVKDFLSQEGETYILNKIDEIGTGKMSFIKISKSDLIDEINSYLASLPANTILGDKIQIKTHEPYNIKFYDGSTGITRILYAQFKFGCKLKNLGSRYVFQANHYICHCGD